jgi:aspartate kinase
LKNLVYKFGGSSVRDAKAILRVAKLIAQNNAVKVAVLSATYNTTNRLEWVYSAFEEGDEARAIVRLEEVKHHHQLIFNELCELLALEKDCQNEWQQRLVAETSVPYMHFKRKDSLKTLDFLYSYGEWVSSFLVYFTLHQIPLKRKILWQDAREIILTDDQSQMAEPLLEQMIENAKTIPWLHDDSLILTQGFIGKDPAGETTTLGREGSDYSATLMARLLESSEVTIWTDVRGVASFDPRLIESVLWHDHLSYKEAEFLASGGAKVLFPRTLSPVIDLKIPVIVRSSLETNLGMSCISEQNLKGFALALDNHNPSQLSIIINFDLDKVAFFQPYPEILEMSFDGNYGKLTISSSIALEVTRRIHQDLYSQFNS